jgi:hypothetical protein
MILENNFLICYKASQQQQQQAKDRIAAMFRNGNDSNRIRFNQQLGALQASKYSTIHE